MNIKHALAPLTGLWLCMVASAPAAELVPQTGTLAIPVTTVKAPGSVECVVTFGPPVPVSAVAFSPDGKTLATAAYQEVLLWDLANGKLLKRLGAGELGTSIGALAFLKDGKLLAVGEGTPASSGAVTVLNVETGKPAFRFEEPKDVVYCLAVSPDGKLLAGGGADGQAYVWNLDDKKLATTIKEHTGWILGVCFSPDGKTLGTAGADNALKLWEVGTWNSVARLPADAPVRGAVLLADGNNMVIAVSGPNTRGLRLRQKKNVRYKRTASTGAGAPLGLVLDAKANKVYASCSDNTVKVFDTRNMRLLATLSGHQGWVYSVALSPDGSKLASGSGDGTVKLWNTKDNRELATFVQLSPRAEEWLIMTAQGYLATSSAGALTWRAANMKTPVGEITGILHKPELVPKAIAGEKTEPPALQ